MAGDQDTETSAEPFPQARRQWAERVRGLLGYRYPQPGVVLTGYGNHISVAVVQAQSRQLQPAPAGNDVGKGGRIQVQLRQRGMGPARLPGLCLPLGCLRNEALNRL